MAMVVVAVLLGACAAVLTATGAQAHAALTSITPADGARLTKAPTQVVLTFDEPVSTSFAVVAVTDGSGRSVVAGRARVDGATVTQPLKADLGSGAYTVAYRVVSDDGHPVSDKTTFTLALPASQSPTSVASATAVPTATPAAPSQSTTSGSATATRGSGSGGGGPAWVWVALAVVVLAAVGGPPVAQAGRRRQGR